jgi:polyketide biosynthesis 3-hydroxy-3-methylglutaryl-CoA synthase-like enzyme PksG
MLEKTVAMPFEDPVSFAVNAAKPVVDALSADEKRRIEMIITCTESGVDFGKSVSTYVHEHLGLHRNCRLFELKQACYCTTAGYQMALNAVLSDVSPGAKVLVIGTDIARFTVVESGRVLSEDWAFAEPSSGAGAVCLLVSDTPRIFAADIGCNGCYGYEVMDACRPVPDSEAGDTDLSLLSYLDCCEHSYRNYCERVDNVDYVGSFGYLSFHTPFGGMIKGAHRNMMRKVKGAKPPEIQADFERRVQPGLTYCQRVGNIMGATVFLSLASTIDNAAIDEPTRIGVFSYGSGCCSEFYSGTVTAESKARIADLDIPRKLDSRASLTIDDYDRMLHTNRSVAFGTRNTALNYQDFPCVWERIKGTGRLVLKGIREFHREYEWV